MSVSQDMVATWRRPRAVMRKLLAMGVREDRALALLFAACLMIFVGQLPRLQRANTLEQQEWLAMATKASDQVATFQAEIAITGFAWLLVWPLMFYLIGGLTHIIARLFGGKGSFYSARLALFWALLASSPAWLFHGLVSGFIGPGPAQQIAGVIVIGSFLGFWSICLREAETNPEGAAP
ncbi:YIP1 family protein [Rhodobacteraceae bacterium M385]|nr:YIP1 family protein [Rhodobacteraceae bacterium M385]